jgi:hypothetical protein
MQRHMTTVVSYALRRVQESLAQPESFGEHMFIDVIC